MEIGEFVRTITGEIHKVVEIKEDLNDMNYYIYENNMGDFSVCITKHSKNIIDLIQEGDFVNGYYCRYITDINTGEKHLCNYDLNVMQWIPLKDIDVLGEILTKEQYEKNCYVVGE